MLGLIAVIVAAAAALGAAALQGAETTRTLAADSSVRRTAAELEKFTCLEHELRRTVPAGTTVFVAELDTELAQRLAELSSPRTRVVATRTAAEVVVRAERVPEETTGSCQGLRVKAEPGSAP